MSKTETDNNNKRKRQSITLDTKIVVLKLIDEGYSVRDVAQKLNISRGTVQNAKNYKDCLLKEDESIRSMQMTRMIRHNSSNIELNSILWRWYRTARINGDSISNRMIQNKAVFIANSLFDGTNNNNHTSFKASNGWLEKWKKRYNVNNFTTINNSESSRNNVITNIELADEQLKESLESLRRGYTRADFSRKKARQQTSVVIITFDIGGKTFKVSKDLLQKYPNTMLYMMISEIKTTSNNINEPIFVDGNSERFPYIIDYMKFNEVELPLHIGKQSFIKELEYYGFQNNNIILNNNIDTISQKIKRQERMALVASKCITDIFRINHTNNDNPTTPDICMNNDWNDNNIINNWEYGLHIIFDSKHEEHEQYCSTFEHDTTIIWLKDTTTTTTTTTTTEIPLIRPGINDDGKRVVTIRTY